ncbi:MAG: metal ABC transporter substrate-binding protein, partial [Clostridia bacterium]|nr:metal ABC transporter substrate-binding protein [Clostridia bacterium]
MKRICSLILPLLLLFGIACAPTAPASMTDRADTALSVVTTIFPIYDWTREILGSEADDVELSMLLDSGVDLHSFQPSAEDIVRISTCDVFLYVGGESDERVGDALKESQNPNQVVINLLDLLGDAVKEEEV